jgi:hypothetical protein
MAFFARGLDADFLIFVVLVPICAAHDTGKREIRHVAAGTRLVCLL